ncbi:hypothetical protein V7654_01550, partial [Bacillus sp. JJ1609]|uniref:hypothetical protein n=1 Tax=Bacillus sp. JJ1609 TaxID=3122977 RepID=UPI002FFDDFF6
REQLKEKISRRVVMRRGPRTTQREKQVTSCFEISIKTETKKRNAYAALLIDLHSFIKILNS